MKTIPQLYILSTLKMCYILAIFFAGVNISAYAQTGEEGNKMEMKSDTTAVDTTAVPEKKNCG